MGVWDNVPEYGNIDSMIRDSRFLQKKFRNELIPVMISLLGGTVNTLIDSAFVARKLDSDALAALGLNMPVFLTLCLIGCLFGSGAFVSASREFGHHGTEKAARLYHTALLSAVIAGGIVMLTGIFFSDGISVFICNDAGILPMVEDYCRITLIGALPYVLIYFPNYFLQLDGKTRKISRVMLTMMLTDILFDWIFIYLLDMGVAGAAYASVFSMVIACIYGFACLQDRDGIFYFRWKYLGFTGLRSILSLGSTQAIGSLMATLRMFFLNRLILMAGGTDAMATWTVINSMIEISKCIISGVPRTASPLLGVYIGGYDDEGIKMLVRLEIKTGLILVSAFSAVLIVLNHPIGLFFKLDRSVLIPLVCLCISLEAELLCSVLGSYYNVAGRVGLSNYSMILRSFLCPVLSAFVLYLCKGLIWLFMPVGMILCLLCTLFLARRISYPNKSGMTFNSGILFLNTERNGLKDVVSLSIDGTDEKICEASEAIVDFCVDNSMDLKTATKLGLSLEEVMTVMAEKSLRSKDEPVDVRVFSDRKGTGITIMCSGSRYDLFEEAQESEDDFDLGIRLIQKIARECDYTYTLGLNILTVGI